MREVPLQVTLTATLRTYNALPDPPRASGRRGRSEAFAPDKRVSV